MLSILEAMDDSSDVIFLGNYSGREADLVKRLGHRVLLGFPAAGGILDGITVRYVPITQQRTMLGEPDGSASPRLQSYADVGSFVSWSISLALVVTA